MDLEAESEKSKKPKSKMKATKDYKLLSFGEEAEEEEDGLKNVQVLLAPLISMQGCQMVLFLTKNTKLGYICRALEF
jgi:hypothetical protein